MALTQEGRAEFVATIPEALRWRFMLDERIGCFQAVQGPRSGNHKGYPSVSIDGHSVLLHRWLWQSAHGPVPAGKQLVRLCWVSDCCRLSHMTPLGWSALHLAWRAHRRHMAALGPIMADRPSPPTSDASGGLRPDSAESTTVQGQYMKSEAPG